MPEYEAILLLSFGGPESKEDVIPFLKNVTSGKAVPLERLQEVEAQYALFDGLSPINQQNRDLITALAEELGRYNSELPIYFGNRNWEPFLQDAVEQIVNDGHRKVLAFVTSAFGSYSGCRQYQEDINNAVENIQVDDLTIDKIRLFWNHPKYLSAVE
ncbi:MAG: ferrochelatase, partial [Actinomycetota bacterium]|nr:ferrochelatase [Actinomycetota bacterium]